MNDPFHDPSEFGAAELQRRRTVDHESCHVAAAVALGWDVNGVEVDPVDATGWTRIAPPSLRDTARVHRERLTITVTPRVVLGDEGGLSGGDSRDAWQDAQRVAAGGDGERWCYVSTSETRHAIHAAACEAHRLSETAGFRAVRYVVRELVADLGTVGRLELTSAIGSATEMVVMHLAERRAERAGELVG